MEDLAREILNVATEMPVQRVTKGFYKANFFKEIDGPSVEIIIRSFTPHGSEKVHWLVHHVDHNTEVILDSSLAAAEQFLLMARYSDAVKVNVLFPVFYGEGDDTAEVLREDLIPVADVIPRPAIGAEYQQIAERLKYKLSVALEQPPKIIRRKH
jgi:hypothetical protein